MSLKDESDDVAVAENWKWRYENWDGNRWRDYLSSKHTEYGTQPRLGLQIPVGLIKRAGSNESVEAVGKRIIEHGPGFIEFLKRYIQPKSEDARIQQFRERNHISESDEDGMLRAREENERMMWKARRDLEELKNVVRFFEGSGPDMNESPEAGDTELLASEPHPATNAESSQRKEWKEWKEDWNAHQWQSYLTRLVIEYEQHPELKGQCPSDLWKCEFDLEDIEWRIIKHGPSLVQFLEQFDNPDIVEFRIQGLLKFFGLPHDDVNGLATAREWAADEAVRAKRHVSDLKSAILFFKNRASATNRFLDREEDRQPSADCES